MAGPRSQLKAHYRLIGRLLTGAVLDRQAIAKELGVQVAAADQQIRAMVEAIPQLIVERDRSRHRTIRLRPENVQREPSKTMAVAACLGAALSNLFRGSAYERNLRAALEHVLERVKSKSEFKDADRKFYFVAQGGETALPDNEVELDEVVDAILGNLVLKFDYLHFAGKAKTRTVEPLTLAVYQHQLYLLAREDGHIVVVRFSRIRNANATRKRFIYPNRLEYDPNGQFRNILGIFANDEPALSVADVELRLTGFSAREN